MDVTSIALSGLNAAQQRLANSANNIANARTPNFTPTDVVQSPVNNGGVRADVVERSPASFGVPNGRGDIENLPNVSLEQEVVESVTAAYDFKANLQVLKTQKELDKALLDIQA